MRKLKSIGVVVALHRTRARRAALALVKWAKRRGMEVRLREDAASVLDLKQFSASESEVGATDLVVALGGDGTVLYSTRTAAPFGTPVLAVDVGGFGFLSEVKDSRLTEALEKIVAGDFEVERRMMLKARVKHEAGGWEELLGLNDAVITKGAFSRIMRLKIYADGEPIAAFPADGLIASTPTGSTAYSLSAGGPVVNPKLSLLIITPICPHTLFARPIIIPDFEEVKVEIRSLDPEQEVMLTVDGQLGRRLDPQDEVYISRAPHDALFIRFHPHGFYRKLRTKLRWGRAL